jgi:hypothetical protein
MQDPTPLSTLLSWVWIAHTIEVDNVFEAASADRVGRCVRISLPMWTNGLRHIDEDGISVDQMRARARAACNIGGLERWGWISVGEPSTQRRDGYGSHRGVTATTVLRPTRAGRYARRAWPKVVQAVEARWQTRYGSEAIETLRQALSAQLAPAGALPWSPPEVNPSDGFRTHVVDVAAPIDPERPLVALLGAALTKLTIEQERDAEVSLPLGANLLRVIGSDAVRLKDLPRLGGISKEAVAMAVSYLQRRGFATTAPQRTLSLTADGLDALDGYRHGVTEADTAGLVQR